MTAYEELVSMTGGDREAARKLLDGLRRMAQEAPDPQLRRFAADVLAGHVTLREAARSEAYDAVLSPHFHGLTRWRDALRERERRPSR
ncbi:hypothetical protein RB614_28705 [Phytohabitans sp. ZYX-F-186]|uniref:Uncharacterized protein n=1 Tax=Phytohabitans maris TaxID=3071409 RepID=A0ABU0ZNA6_9ACTN|nr:hypothetical protein [Phytohabitans sp. ZYX-F-186]MDQ7908517.1 hypothetical protein [Phytohabitans sp. ZYX-F-186]